MIKTLQKRNILVLLFCLCTSFLVLLTCTRCSFLYAFQDWVDDNIIFTMGRGLMNGKVLYRDLVDQKGPFLFLVYGIASLISSKSFIGVFCLEILSFGLFLYFSYKTIQLFEKRNSLFVLPIIAMLTASSTSFSAGGSAEEFMLPFLSYSLYSILRVFKIQEDCNPSWWKIGLNGLLAGCVFMTKYTMTGFYIGWIAMLFVFYLTKKEIKKAFQTVLFFLMGMMLAIVPWIIYLVCNEALSAFYRIYFYLNIFGYGADEGRTVLQILTSIRMSLIHTFNANKQYSLLIILGILYLTISKHLNGSLSLLGKIALWIICILTSIGIFFGNYSGEYYGVVLMIFVPLGFIPILRVFHTIGIKEQIVRKKEIILASVSLLLCGFLAFLLTDNTFMLPYEKNDFMQYQYAELMKQKKKEEKVSVLCYKMMDYGIYLTSGYEPEFPYFTALNFHNPELVAEQDRYVEEELTEFIVTRDLELNLPNYQEITHSQYKPWDGMETAVFYLYQRTW